ncbi:MAG: DUF481 domain-containing protein, partial [Gemmatimonadaceae bacterium]
RVALNALAAGVVLCVPRETAAAQKAGWHSMIEANASTLFGATSQTLMSLAAGLSHAGEGFTSDATFAFRYGESEDGQRVKFVNARGWAVNVSVDGTPNGRVSPFVLASAEASLEKRIASRRSGGVGAKWVFAKSNTGSASVSAAILGERTAALSDTAVAVTRVARWSWRIKMVQKVDDRLSLSHVTFYGPRFNVPSQYTITSTSVGSFSINKAVALTLTFNDNFDSQARARGAPTNNDGSLLFGVRGTF